MTDTRRWRVGTHYGIHGYSDGERDASEPLFTALRPEIAKQVIDDHNFLHGNGNATRAQSVQTLLEWNHQLTEEVKELKRRMTRMSKDAMRTHATISRLRAVIEEELPDSFSADEADCA